MEVFNFGKFNGKTFEEVFKGHKSYVEWVKNVKNPTGLLLSFKKYVEEKESEVGNSGGANLNSNKSSFLRKKSSKSDGNIMTMFQKTGSGKIQSNEGGAERKGDLENGHSSINNDGNRTYLTGGNGGNVGKSESRTFCGNGNDHKGDQRNIQKMNSKEYRNYELQILNKIQNDKEKGGERIELDLIIAFEVQSEDFFKIVQKDANAKKFATFKNFVPKELFKILSEFNPTIKKIHNYSCITFESDRYEFVLKGLKERCTILGGIEEIPNFLLKCFQKYVKFSKPKKICEITANILTDTMEKYTKENYSKLDYLLGEELSRELKPFQREGVLFGLKNNGRVLIGDEMGLGKTLQALALMAFYKDDWPFIVVCPSSIRFQWKDQALRWLSHLIDEDHICVIKSGKSEIPNNTKMIVISYEMIAKNEKYQHKYKSIICDESHYLKNSQSKRTKAIVPLIKSAKRCILLSGTPALNRPSELYEQVSSIIPNLFTYDEFCGRYCYKDKNVYTRKLEYVGSKHTEELHVFLTKTIMIRRLKKDVLKELPDKLRSKIPIEIPPKELNEIVKYLKRLEETNCISVDEYDNVRISPMKRTKGDNFNKNNNFNEFGRGDEEGDMDADDKLSISHLFKITGIAKVKGIKEYITYLIEADIKFLLFCHHKTVMDELEIFLKEKNVHFIKVDGSTAMDKREEYIKKFQNDETVKIALLSITACGTGLNLTAANTVVFGELFWVPGQMIQAEDRAHRIGSTHDAVNVHYLIAQNTMDEIIWRTINKKWNTLTTALNGMEDSLNVKEVQKFDEFMTELTHDTTRSYPSSLLTTPKKKRKTFEFVSEEKETPVKKEKDIRDFFKPVKKSVEKEESEIENEKEKVEMEKEEIVKTEEKARVNSEWREAKKRLKLEKQMKKQKEKKQFSTSGNSSGYSSANSSATLFDKRVKNEF